MGSPILVESCRQRDVVTVDTEFQRTDTYYPVVGLIQVYDGEICYLADPLALDSLGPFAELLADSSVLKVFHACSEDMEVFDYAVGEIPSPVFDTQIAAAVLGAGFSMSYQNLVEHHLSISVPKEQTRSDWLKRPLTSAQLEYAALDVVYLYDVYREQADALAQQSREQWIAEECAGLGEELAINVDPRQTYLPVESAGRMKPEELNVLRELCAWREGMAREMNLLGIVSLMSAPL
ncbi:MAG: hypothetical protein U5O39_14925 [Gammaproteobacteria bacterium]|nr:hypothetical protein [Gammaproteobacteria bacterium]